MASRCVVTQFQDISLCPPTAEVWLAPDASEAERHLDPNYKTEFNAAYGAIADVSRALAQTHHKTLTAPYMILTRHFSDALDEGLRHANPMAQSDWGVISTVVQVAGGTIPFFYDLAAGAVDHSQHGLWTAIATPVVQFADVTAESARGLGVSVRDIHGGYLQRVSPFKASEFFSTQVVVAGGLLCFAKGAVGGGTNFRDQAMGPVPRGEVFVTDSGTIPIHATIADATRTSPSPNPGGLAILAGDGAGGSDGGRQVKRDAADDATNPYVPLRTRVSAIRELGQRGDLQTLSDIVRTRHPTHPDFTVRVMMVAIDAMRAIDTEASNKAFREPNQLVELALPEVLVYWDAVVDSIGILSDFKNKRQSAVQTVQMIISAPHFRDVSLFEAFARWNADDALIQDLRRHALRRLAENGSPQAAAALFRIAEDVGLSEAQMDMIAATPQRPRAMVQPPNLPISIPQSQPPRTNALPNFTLPVRPVPSTPPTVAATPPPQATGAKALFDKAMRAVGLVDTPVQAATKLLGVDEAGLRPLLEDMGHLRGDGLNIVQRCQNDAEFKAQVTAALQSLETHEPRLQSVAKDARDKVNGRSRFSGLEID